MWACDPALTSEIVGTYHGMGPVFVGALQAFLAAQCALLGDHLWPADAEQAVLQDPNYDFIVVGAGSAGAVVANRLSEVPHWKVLLIEAGGNPTLTTEVPQIFFNNVESPIDWGYKTHPQDNACRSYKTKGCAWPRGKVLGGCSSFNGMYYIRANQLDYDEWEAQGNSGWKYKDILKYFKKSENFSEPLSGDYGKYHGNQGYLSVEMRKDAADFETLLIKAASEIGVKHEHDVNGANQMGICKTATTTKDGVRHSTARAFLSPIKNRTNLHVLKNAMVTKILFKSDQVVSGVVVNKNNKEITLSASKEVILSAGAINTPQLMMLSGIGPRKHLEELGIDVIADLHVGENLKDHAYIPLYYKFPGDKDAASLPNLIGALGLYMFNKTGPFATTSPSRVVAFFNTTDPNANSPDIQFHYVLFPPKVSNFINIYSTHGFSEELIEKFNKLNEEHNVLMVATVLLKPKSKGKIILKNKDPNQHPIIYANYFDEKEDLLTLIRGMKKHALKLAETKTFKSVGLEFKWVDLDACKGLDKSTDEFLECYSKELTTSLYHPTSTTKMGPDTDEYAVVDHELRVRKVKGLRVIDASIMPDIVRGNTNAPTIMIGEKGAEMIKHAWLKGYSEL